MQDKVQESVVKASIAFEELRTRLEEVVGEFSETDSLLNRIFLATYTVSGQERTDVEKVQSKTQMIRGVERELPLFVQETYTDKGVTRTREVLDFSAAENNWLPQALRATADYFEQFNYLSRENYDKFDSLRKTLRAMAKDRRILKTEFDELRKNSQGLLALVRDEVTAARNAIRGLLAELRNDHPQLTAVLADYSRFRDAVLSKLREKTGLRTPVGQR